MLTLEQLALLHARYRDATRARVREFSLGNKELSFNSRRALMGVINLSPDSWYRESVCLSTDKAIQRGLVLAAQGADIVDIGAESTLSNASRVSAAKQSTRLLPVIRGLREAGVPVSVETYEPLVARAVLKAGANVLNLTGTGHSRRIFDMAAEFDAAVIICYVQGKNVREVGDFQFAGDLVGTMHDYFARATEAATHRGVTKLFLDPGLGFYYRNLLDSATRVRYQMEVFLSSFRLRTLGFPVCHALPHAFEYFGEEVRCAEPFFAVLAALGQTDLFRTHEVPRTKAVLDALAAYDRPLHD
jgi:dihydropteroate synthase